MMSVALSIDSKQLRELKGVLAQFRVATCDCPWQDFCVNISEDVCLLLRRVLVKQPDRSGACKQRVVPLKCACWPSSEA